MPATQIVHKVLSVPAPTGEVAYPSAGKIVGCSWKVGTGTLKAYDGLNDTGTLILELDAAGVGQGFTMNRRFNAGLYVETTGSVAFYLDIE